MEVGGRSQDPVALPPVKRPGIQDRSGRVPKISPTGFHPRTAQPIASRYTDWAIPAHSSTVLIDFIKLFEPQTFSS